MTFINIQILKFGFGSGLIIILIFKIILRRFLLNFSRLYLQFIETFLLTIIKRTQIKNKLKFINYKIQQSSMLKARKLERKRKLAKYMKKVLKKKRVKSQQFDIELKEQYQEPIEAQVAHKNEQVSDGEAVWEDPDDENMVDLNSMNLLKKLRRGDEQISQKELQKRLKAYKASKNPTQYESWAQGGEVQNQKDYQDILHEQLLDNNLSSKEITINYLGKCQKRHNSVITGVQWHNKVVFTTGLDKTLRIWTFDEFKPEFSKTLELQKTVYLQNLPLTSCSSMNEKIYMGTLRKNYAVFDLNKNYASLITSAYLSKHANYKNLKAGNNFVGIASSNCLSIMNGSNQFVGELWSNEPINDFSFGENQVVGVSKEALYLWDLRKMRARQVVRQGLNFTSVKLSTTNPMLSVGSQSGVLYLYRKADEIGEIYKEIGNLVTSITGICESLNGSFLASYSKWKRNALKIVKTEDCSVLATWPGVNTKLNYPTAANWSANASYLAVGAANGSVSIYNIGYGDAKS